MPLQAARVAKARFVPIAEIRALAERSITGRSLGIFGEPHVNVLALNQALQKPIRNADHGRRHVFPQEGQLPIGTACSATEPCLLNVDLNQRTRASRVFRVNWTMPCRSQDSRAFGGVHVEMRNGRSE